MTECPNDETDADGHFGHSSFVIDSGIRVSSFWFSPVTLSAP